MRIDAFAILAGLVGAKLVAQLTLAALNAAEVRRHAQKAPPAVAAVMDAETYANSVAYSLEKNKFEMIELVYDSLILLIILAGGIIPWMFGHIGQWAPQGRWDDALFVLATVILVGIPGLVFDWYGQFKLEAKFGFNKSSQRLWVTDKLKGFMLVLVIGFPLLWALLALVDFAGRAWWLWGFGLVLGFQLLMLVLYPKLILPLFNKLSPLEDGALRDRLLALGDRTGFKAAAIEVMDGSKRSGHSNAFFTGFGRFRRIVLFDTLIKQLEPEELEAVLAHEVGHYRRGHIPRMLFVSAAMMFAGFAAIAWLTQSAWFNPAFGLPAGEPAPALLLFMILSGLVTFWISPLGNIMSRKHEYEADAFARDAMGGPAPLVGALRKLSQKNLSNLTPHPWFSGFYYSHPTLVEREAAMNQPVV